MPISPMMQHYLHTKEKYKDCILLYRLGDFYEMFFEDAVEVSRVLGLTLTGRDCGLDERAPMCGIPHHALENYTPKLLEKGYKVAVCEQLTQPEKGTIVERDVVRVITAGTITDSNLLDENRNNYIASLCLKNNNIGISWSDISTGDFFCTEILADEEYRDLQDLLTRISPSEIICNAEMMFKSNILPCVKYKFVPNFTAYYDWAFEVDAANKIIKDKLQVSNLDGFGLKGRTLAICASGALLSYFDETQKRSLEHINKIVYKENNGVMSLDMNTRRNLELCSTLQDGKKYGSLLWLLDETNTCMGARNLRTWIEQPLQSKLEIDMRLEAIGEIKDDLILQNDIKQAFLKIKDIERLTGKIAYNSITPRDVESLSKSLKTFPDLHAALCKCKSELVQKYSISLVGLEDITKIIDSAIMEDAPITLKDGGFIKHGYNSELDSYLEIKEQGHKWLAKFENKEREKTGIKNLKIGYNKIFGYFIEVTKSYQQQIPYYFTRKQTLANCERYITDELKEMENKILNASDNLIRLEMAIFAQIRSMLVTYTKKLQDASKAIAVIDTILSLAIIANKYNYVRPNILQDNSVIEIKDGRHPVVEALLKGEQFISNDVCIDNASSRGMLITGPNMAGKSTYMRQVALIVLLAHIGSFVPASKANISITDKIFTRVGASDNLAFSQSTFMVEMTEVANILNNVTNNSLIILDEVGRGTSTYDGMSIAWAVMDYLIKHTTAKILFATHYHELTELENLLEGVKNYQVMVKELSDGIIFLRKIVRGGADKSFGIEVAKLAGLPKEVIENAKKIMNTFHSENQKPIFEDSLPIQSGNNEVINILRDVNVDNLTPLIAFDTIISLKNKIKD